MHTTRHDGRLADQLRPFKISYDVFTFGVSSVLLEVGNTKVLCTISLQPSVPSFLRGKGSGWLTAEYALLPNATHVRTVREGSTPQRNGRNVEISRFIGRVLRTVMDMRVLGEQTVYIDCDVLQADGGTRTACITAASLALQRAQVRWLEKRQISAPLMREAVMAVAVGVRAGQLLLDPDYAEDQSIDADFNIVVTETNNLIEIQGGAEKAPLSWHLFDQLRLLAIKGIEDIKTHIPQVEIPSFSANCGSGTDTKKSPFFSLKNRHSALTQS